MKKKAHRTLEGNEYGITRCFNRDGIPSWRVSLGRRRHMIYRTFYDSIYGGCDEALAMARNYRDAALKIVPPNTNLDMTTIPRITNTSGTAGVCPIRNKKGDVTGWEAILINRGTVQRQRFSINKYGELGAKEVAIEERRKWLENLHVAFLLQNDQATEVAEENFPEYLEATATPLTLEEQEIRCCIAELNARFDALRPLWVTVRITTGKKKNTFFLSLSDGGQPARYRQTSVSMGNRSLGMALAILRSKAASFIETIFGTKLCECFLFVYGREFNVGRFDPEQGVTIRERPDTIRKAAQRKGYKASEEIDRTLWLKRWEVESWREGRHFWDKSSVNLFALAVSLEKITSQKPPVDPSPSSVEKRLTSRDRDVGRGIFRYQEKAWRVQVARQGRNIVHAFFDSRYGGRDAALEIAKAYRDTLYDIFRVSRTYAAHRAIDNDTIPGVHPVRSQGVVTGWCALIQSKRFGIRREYFSLADYSEEEAKERAIACREKWLTEMLEATGERKPFSDEEFDTVLHGINVQFGISGKIATYSRGRL